MRHAVFVSSSLQKQIRHKQTHTTKHTCKKIQKKPPHYQTYRHSRKLKTSTYFLTSSAISPHEESTVRAAALAKNKLEMS